MYSMINMTLQTSIKALTEKSVDEQTRKRNKALKHLPLRSVVWFAEVDLSQTVSKQCYQVCEIFCVSQLTFNRSIHQTWTPVQRGEKQKIEGKRAILLKPLLW